MEICSVDLDQLLLMEERYHQVVEELDEEGIKRVEKRSECRQNLLDILLVFSNHSERYLRYVLSRNFQAFNIFHVLNNPKEGTLNQSVLARILNVWSSFRQSKDIFGARDSMEIPYMYLLHLLVNSHSCSSCGNTVDYKDILYVECPKCTCGASLVTDTCSAESLLPYGVRSKIKRYSSLRKKVII